MNNSVTGLPGSVPRSLVWWGSATGLDQAPQTSPLNLARTCFSDDFRGGARLTRGRRFDERGGAARHAKMDATSKCATAMSPQPIDPSTHPGERYVATHISMFGLEISLTKGLALRDCDGSTILAP